MSNFPFRFSRLTARQWIAVIAIFALAALYASTLQTHISGTFEESQPSSILKNEYIKDVGEIQVALNLWGTIHHTGYPLFAILGNGFTTLARAVGFGPATAASLYALWWGIVALGAVGALIGRLTGRPALAALSVLLLGAARSIWLHNVIAEVYSMSLAIMALLLLIALWPAPWAGAWSAPRRVWWMALLGGIGVSHHRAVIFIAPALLVAVWPALQASLGSRRAAWQRLIAVATGLALLGFVPYLYLPIREWQGGDWVYGEPGTWAGFWTEFTGREADRLVKLPDGLAGLWANAHDVGAILARELTLPGAILGLGALVLAILLPGHRREARLLALGALGPLLFALFYHTAVLPQAILMPVVMTLVIALALALDTLLDRVPARHHALVGSGLALGLVVWAGGLIAWNHPYITELVDEPSGLETIERLRYLPTVDEDGAPIQAVVMLPWGPRYAAASYARLLTGELEGVLVVDHKANYPALLSQGARLYTLPETFYTVPPPWPSAYGSGGDWWTEHLGAVTLTSAAPGIVQVLNTPWLSNASDTPTPVIVHGIGVRDAWLSCDADFVYLHVLWSADQRPAGDPSIFVHLTGDEPAPNPINADARHPVYGAYPFAAWSPGEIVRDDFTLPRTATGTQVRFGLYEQDNAGQFANYGERVLPVAECQPVEYKAISDRP